MFYWSETLRAVIRENYEAHNTVTSALKNIFPMGIGSGDMLVRVRTGKIFFSVLIFM